jgi:RimJ/RimL family protein N-acetyltransferase
MLPVKIKLSLQQFRVEARPYDSGMKFAPSELMTSRLRLRRVRNEDIDPFVAMNADVRVMEFFPCPWSREESKAALVSIEEGFENRGFGIYAVDYQNTFAGIVGLSVPSFEAHFTPCVEILWRLVPRFWGRGFASEAAEAVLEIGFNTLVIPEIVAFAVVDNVRSIGVMERLGMQRDLAGDFNHPAVEASRLKRHLLY